MNSTHRDSRAPVDAAEAPSGRRSKWEVWGFRLSLISAALTALLTLGPLEALELSAQDLRLAASPNPPSAPPILLVGITPQSYERYAEFPELFWGMIRAQALRRAAGLGARVVALDFLQLRSADAFLNRLQPKVDLFGGAPDQLFAEAVRDVQKSGTRVVLGWSLRGGLRPVEPLGSSGADLAFLDRGPEAAEEQGGVVRHVLLGVGSNSALQPGFAAAVALRMHGETPTDPGALRRLETPFVGGPWPHSMRVNFTGGSVRGNRSRFRAIPLEMLLEGDLSPELQSAFQGAAVLIGPMDDAANDLHRAPGGEYHGVEIHAHALATLLDNRPLRRLPLSAEATLALALGLLAAWLLRSRRLPFAVEAAVLALAAGAVWITASLGLQHGWLIPVVGPTLALPAVMASTSLFRFIHEFQARGWAEQVLGRQVDSRVARTLLDQEAANELGGRTREVTVLFTDLRGFTSWADQTDDPATLLPILNAYLEEMAECVRAEEGTLDKYIGDAVMAFWNAPFPQQDHPARAVRCTLRMRERLEAFNADRELNGEPPLRMGAGIQSGQALVGQVGSRRRMSYTVIGTTVNVAARLESATKELPDPGACEVLIGDGAWERLAAAGAPFRGESVTLPLKGLARAQTAWRLDPHALPGGKP